MNDTEYKSRCIWRWTAAIVAGVVATVIAGFIISGSPTPGKMASAPLVELEALYARRPKDNDVAYYYAHALAGNGDKNRAYMVMAEAVARDPRSTRNLLQLAHYAAMLGHAREMFELHHRIIALNPSDAEAHSELGHILAEAGLLTEALREYDQALKLDPKVEIDEAPYAACLVHAGRYEEAWQKLVLYFNNIPRQDEPYETLTQAGIKLGKFDDTAMLLTRRITMDSEYPLCRFQYCEAQVALARPRTDATLKAAEAWAFASTHDTRATKEMHPIKADYFALAARIHEEQGRMGDARSALLDGLKVDGANKECLQEMVRISERTGDPKVETWRQAYRKSAGENAKTAGLRRALELRPHDASAAVALAAALEQKGRLSEASDLCFDVLSFAPRDQSAATILERCRTAALVRLEVEAKQRYADLRSGS